MNLKKLTNQSFFFERMLLNESEYMNKASQDVEYIDVNK